jgi:hypothetical protein
VCACVCVWYVCHVSGVCVVYELCKGCYGSVYGWVSIYEWRCVFVLRSVYVALGKCVLASRYEGDMCSGCVCGMPSVVPGYLMSMWCGAVC